MDMKRFFLYAIVIAALALAGCGGGNGTTAAPPPPPPPPPPMSYDVTVPSADVMLSEADMMPFTGEKTVGDVTFTCPSGSTCTLTQGDDGVITSTGGEVTAAFSQEYKDRMADAAAAAMARTNGILGAIVSPMDPDDPTTARGVNFVNRPGNKANEAIIVVAGAADTNVKPAIGLGTLTDTADAAQILTDLNAATTINDTFNKDDMVGTPATSVLNQFMKKMDSDTQLGRFSGSVHEKTVGNVKDTLTLYTNMEDSKPLTFQSYYAVTDRPGVTGTAATDTLTLALTVTSAAADLFVSDYFPTGNSQTNVHADDDPATPGNQKTNGGLSFAGTFNGVSGMYICAAGGASCTSQTNAQGKLATLVGTWTFKATGSPAQIMISGVDHDADYLAFGYWLRETTTDDKTTYGVGTFANGATPMALSVVQALTGKAVYQGPAAGRYGLKTLDSSGQEVSGGRKVGEFTADAKLTANFGGTSVAADDAYSITGTVTGFKDGETAIPGKWTLNLMRADFHPSETDRTITTPSGQPTGTFSGETTGDGDWQGRFFGAAGTGGAVTTTLPTGVAGEFTGHFVNGHVIGGFGAEKNP